MMTSLNFTNESRDIGGFRTEVLNFNGVEYVRLADVFRFLPKSAEPAKIERVAKRDVYLNDRVYRATVIGGEEYLTVGESASALNRSMAGFTSRLSKLKSEQGIDLRHKFRINDRCTYIKVSDLIKYFLSEEM